MGNEKLRRLKDESVEDLIALDSNVIIEAHDPADVSRGGIVLPDKAKKQSFRGTVISVGPGKRSSNGDYMPLGIEVGDVLAYRNFTGWLLLEVDGKSYYGISGDEYFAKIPKAKVRYE